MRLKNKSFKEKASVVINFYNINLEIFSSFKNRMIFMIYKD
jgi:hypothetical protein